MSKLAVVYWSSTGNTEAMANAVAEGIQAAGAECEIFTASDFNAGMIDEYDAIAFGCPATGTESLDETEFEPMFTECEPKLDGKKIVLFGSYGWGEGEWMRNWEELCKSNNANLVAEGLICNETPDDDALAECKALGDTLVKAL